MASNKKSNKRWRAKNVTPIFRGSQNNNKAKYSWRLLDTISINGDIAAALREFADKYADYLPKSAVKELREIADASSCVHNHAFQQTTKVSEVKNLKAAYNIYKRQLEEKAPQRSGGRASPAMKSVKNFVHLCKSAEKNAKQCKKRPRPDGEEEVALQMLELRRSARTRVTPEKTKTDRTLDFTTFTGKPLDGKLEWTK